MLSVYDEPFEETIRKDVEAMERMKPRTNPPWGKIPPKRKTWFCRTCGAPGYHNQRCDYCGI